MAVYRPDIPPHVAQLIRHLPPELKRSVKQAVRSSSSNPFSGEPLLRELTGLWKYKVRRFRLIYEVDRKARSFGSMRSATGGGFTKNWLIDCAKPYGVNSALRQTRSSDSKRDRAICMSDEFKVFAKQTVKM
jgi:mRNA interferase RelE/StbE